MRGTVLGVPIIRTVVGWGLYWVPLFWESTICCCRLTVSLNWILSRDNTQVQFHIPSRVPAYLEIEIIFDNVTLNPFCNRTGP